MSSAFMYAIAAMYLGAASAFVWEGKVDWGVVCLCWGLGNAVLGMMK